jgi:hypothetical protein
MFSALPAFLLGWFIVDDLAIWGVSQVWSFMVSMPLLISAWFYFLGWLVERRRRKPLADIPATLRSTASEGPQ